MGLGGTGSVLADDSQPRGWACGWSCDDTRPVPRRVVQIHVTVRHADRQVGQFDFEAAVSEDVDETQLSLVHRLSDFLLDHLMQLA